MEVHWQCPLQQLQFLLLVCVSHPSKTILESSMEIPNVPATALSAELSELISAVDPVSFVNVLLQRGFSHRGTDLHLDPSAGGLRVRFRVDGALQDVVRVQGTYATHVISRIKVLCGMDITDKRLPQDGQIVASQVSGIPRDVRVSSLPTILGERLVLRLMPPSDQFVTPETLGLSAEQLLTVNRFLGAPYGLLLVVGPVGAGKTTTVYSLLSKLNRPDRSLVTIEDPVERRIPGASQIQVDTKTGLHFSTALRGVLRQDPNIISIGEIRDAETAQIACRAATTGVLVISTLHANNTASAIDVLRNFGISAMTIADCLRGVIAQRLVRLVSEDAKEFYTASESECELLNCSVQSPPQLARGQENEKNLNTGYFGRTAVIETLEVSPAIRQAISSEQPAFEIRDIAEKEGMTSLQESARQLVMAGRTTISEYRRLVQDVRWKSDAIQTSLDAI
jgi:type II secretory ATPase GspE/PulE/Tfp pilus assembly ATPase PilB-like protein